MEVLSQSRSHVLPQTTMKEKKAVLLSLARMSRTLAPLVWTTLVTANSCLPLVRHQYAKKKAKGNSYTYPSSSYSPPRTATKILGALRIQVPVADSASLPRQALDSAWATSKCSTPRPHMHSSPTMCTTQERHVQVARNFNQTSNTIDQIRTRRETRKSNSTNTATTTTHSTRSMQSRSSTQCITSKHEPSD